MDASWATAESEPATELSPKNPPFSGSRLINTNGVGYLEEEIDSELLSRSPTWRRSRLRRQRATAPGEGPSPRRASMSELARSRAGPEGQAVARPQCRRPRRHDVAVGTPSGCRATVWRLWTNPKGDVYVAARALAGSLKVSLHVRGNWRKAFIGAHPADPTKDRAFLKWKRGPEVSPGLTRALEMLVMVGDVTTPPGDSDPVIVSTAICFSPTTAIFSPQPRP